MRRIIVLSAIAVLFITCVPFSCADDSSIPIYDVDDFLSVWNNLEPYGHYVLMNDITFDNTDYDINTTKEGSSVNVSISPSTSEMTIIFNGSTQDISSGSCSFPIDLLLDVNVVILKINENIGFTTISVPGSSTISLGTTLPALTSPFYGVFDGGGHSLNGLVMTSPLFNTLDSAVIRDLKVSGNFILFKEWESDNIMMSGGTLASESVSSYFENVYLDGNVLCYGYGTSVHQSVANAESGGLIGSSRYDKMLNCSFHGNIINFMKIDGTSCSIDVNCGGLVGRSVGTRMAFCDSSASCVAIVVDNSIDTTYSGDVGILAGEMELSYISGCVSAGAFFIHGDGKMFNVGGATGSSTSSEFSDCMFCTLPYETYGSGSKGAIFGTSSKTMVNRCLIDVPDGNRLIGQAFDCFFNSTVSTSSSIDFYDGVDVVNNYADYLVLGDRWLYSSSPTPSSNVVPIFRFDKFMEGKITITGAERSLTPYGMTYGVISETGDVPISVESDGCSVYFDGLFIVVNPEYDWDSMNYKTPTITFSDGSVEKNIAPIAGACFVIIAIMAIVLLYYNLKSL